MTSEPKCTCPVCGYDDLVEPTYQEICPCCGTQFGYHDAKKSHASLLQQWIDDGMKWSSVEIAAPENWDPVEQVKSLQIVGKDIDISPNRKS